MESIKNEKSCGAVVVARMESVWHTLLLRHRNGGHWSFPKGHVEGAETELETAAREIREEAGLTVTFLPDFRQTECYSPRVGVLKEVVYFLAEAQDICVHTQESEIDGAQWLPLGIAYEKVTFDRTRKVLSAACAYLASYPLIRPAADCGQNNE